MMLAFYGMRMKDRHTGELMRNRNPDFKERMHKTLLTSFHNHMRITRILCSLTETGFGMYAAELCKFLKQEIYDKNVSIFRFRVLWTVYRDTAFIKTGSHFKSISKAKTRETYIFKKSTKGENSPKMCICKSGKNNYKRKNNSWKFFLHNQAFKNRKMLKKNVKIWGRKKTAVFMQIQHAKHYSDCL